MADAHLTIPMTATLRLKVARLARRSKLKAATWARALIAQAVAADELTRREGGTDEQQR